MNTETQTTTHALDIIIFGGAGDLAFRKLLPALYMAHLHGKLAENTRIIGIGRHKWTRNEYIDFIHKQSQPFIESDAFNQENWQRFLTHLDFVSADATLASDYQALKTCCSRPAQRVFYLATMPSLFAQICKHLHDSHLVDEHSRVVLEKPLGTDLASARAINDEVARYFTEKQIYRIDHYLGKETVQNLMVLRFGNAIYEPLWRAPYIKNVQITVAESVGVGSRAGFYDTAGALRDMVQNHLLQLMCIIAMESPISLDADDIRDEKLKVLRSIRKMELKDVLRDTVRGQYVSGVCEGSKVNGYLDEENVPKNSQTETFVALRAYINNVRWANIPFYLRTGKRLQKRQSEIIIEFFDQPYSIFGNSTQNNSNRLIISLQPEESIHLEMMVKEPGSGIKLHPVKLGLDLRQSSDKRRAEAYERLLMDVINGRLTHFMRRDELEAAWAWVDPILDSWKVMSEAPLNYAAGTWGPSESNSLLARENFAWYEEA